MLRNINIKTRLFGLVAFLSIQITVGGIISIVSLGNTNQSMKSMYDDRLVCVGLLDKVIRGIMRNESAMTKAAMGEQASAATTFSQINEQIAAIDEAWAEYMQTDLTPEEKTLAGEFASARQKYLIEAVAPVLDALRTGDTRQARRIIQGPLAALFEPIRTKGNALIKLQLDVAKVQYEDSQQSYRLVRNTCVGAILLSILLAVVVGRWQIQAITAPLDEAVQLATCVAEGNLTCNIEVRSDDEAGKLMQALKNMRDSLVQNATVAQEMNKELRISEANLAEAQRMAHLGSWLLDPSTMKMTWSAETFYVFGMAPSTDAPAFDGFLLRIDSEDRERIRQGLEHSLATGEEFLTEHRIRRGDGALRWVQTISRWSGNSDKTMLRGTVMDITERKETFESLKRSQELLLELSAHRAEVREAERRRIAREIHDELGQTLLALRIDVTMLETRTRNSHPRLNQRVRCVQQQLDATMRTIRAIINNLRPAALDLGLTAAIEWQVKEFKRRSGIACDLTMDAEDYALDDLRATTLFRILQESLTNVMRHSGATHVRIELRNDGTELAMRIADNGSGIDAAARRKANSFGLIGIEERIHALNGGLRIDSRPGKGTTLAIHIPLGMPADVPSLTQPFFSVL